MSDRRAYHSPQLPSNWQESECIDALRCALCAKPVSAHNPDHKPVGTDYNCSRCGVPAHSHKYKEPRGQYLVGIDGEGMDVPGTLVDPRTGKVLRNHIYTLLAYSDEIGRNTDSVYNPTGLSTKQCLDFLLTMPKRARPFAFAFNYDLTMILRDLDNKSLYILFRPELRHVGSKPKAVRWEGYELNLIGTRFSVKRSGKRVHIWDTFRFYQSSFVDALGTWKAAHSADLERMRVMKAARGSFDKYTIEQVRDYCLEECRYMATLTKKLIDAHNKAALPLRAFFGAGSTASVLLKQLGIDKDERNGPTEMDVPVASAFFGGRFENSVCGPVNGVIHSYDISSAYPYQLFSLPCLRCGQWKRTKARKEMQNSAAALVRYSLTPRVRDRDTAWGPLPFRTDDGSIVFPHTSGGGWIWRAEFEAAERHWKGVNFHEAWVYHTDCDHQPFARIAHIYRERLKLGKEGPGIVLKLGANSCYGKLAQSVGRSRPFRSMIWAGIVTSGTRAQLLDAIGQHKDRANCLMLATDGVYSREKLNLPQPIETGTMTEHRKPLGGWEHKVVPNGIFAARPGIYFPLRPTKEEMLLFRARGIGRKQLYENFERIQKAYASADQTVKVDDVVRFHGAKSSVHIGRDDSGKPCFVRSNRYGQWRPRPIEMSFSPLPKREGILKDGTMTLRQFPLDVTSKPYDRALVSDDAMTLKIAEAISLEQPQ